VSDLLSRADALAELVAAAYVAATPDLRALGEPVLGVLLPMYWDNGDVGQIAPAAFAVTERTPERRPPDEPVWGIGAYGGAAIELAAVNVYEDPSLRVPGEALLAVVEEHAAWDLHHTTSSV
jgi:hypothetical protein